MIYYPSLLDGIALNDLSDKPYLTFLVLERGYFNTYRIARNRSGLIDIFQDGYVSCVGINKKLVKIY